MLTTLKNALGLRNPLRLLWHHTKALLAAARYGFPAKKLTVIGITGTDGKTTTVGMTAHILHHSGVKVGAASTAFLQRGSEYIENETHLTSISPFTLQKFLRSLVRDGFTHVVLEMSSHGLVQGRSSYTYPTVAGLTNIALEHLDYHGSMEQYQRDKGILFRMLRGKGTKVLNEDNVSFKHFTQYPSSQTITYGTASSTLSISSVQADPGRSSATVVTDAGSYPLTLNIPGTYNLENALCALGCAQAVGIPYEQGVAALESFSGIPGRMERIDEGQNFSVFVDFTVSPQSYEKNLAAARAMISDENRVLILCSSCGNRMKEKRPMIGEICSRLADVVVATEDETYGEDPHKVLDEVWAGVDQSACSAHKIFDRTEAITFLFNEAKPGDVVLLCGMGPFSTFTKLEGRIPWDERTIARGILQTL